MKSGKKRGVRFGLNFHKLGETNKHSFLNLSLSYPFMVLFSLFTAPAQQHVYGFVGYSFHPKTNDNFLGTTVAETNTD